MNPFRTQIFDEICEGFLFVEIPALSTRARRIDQSILIPDMNGERNGMFINRKEIIHGNRRSSSRDAR
jgi:hypothetical protein